MKRIKKYFLHNVRYSFFFLPSKLSVSDALIVRDVILTVCYVCCFFDVQIVQRCNIKCVLRLLVDWFQHGGHVPVPSFCHQDVSQSVRNLQTCSFTRADLNHVQVAHHCTALCFIALVHGFIKALFVVGGAANSINL